jgi:hypothetical protein
MTSSLNFEQMASPHSLDVLEGKQLEKKLYNNKGYVKLIDTMPRVLDTNKTTSDYAIAAWQECMII